MMYPHTRYAFFVNLKFCVYYEMSYLLYKVSNVNEIKPKIAHVILDKKNQITKNCVVPCGRIYLMRVC